MKLLDPILRRFKKRAPSAATIVKGPDYVFGIPKEIKPVRGIDNKAQAKLVFELDKLAHVVLLSDQQDSSFILEDRGDYWLVDREVSREVLIK